jgi:hypothetical protein
MMPVDREVAGQIEAVDALLPSLSATAGTHAGNLR